MGQMGFFDLGNRYTGLDAKNEPLLKIDGVVPWEYLRARLEAVWRRADKVCKSRAGRKPWDAIVMFKTIIPHFPSIVDIQCDEKAILL